jgi:hypothetical protein
VSDPDVISDRDGAARAFERIGDAHHGGEQATLPDGYRPMGLDGHRVVEESALADADLGSSVADELGGDHAPEKHHPIPQPNGALVFHADGAVGVDTRSALAISERDRAANKCYHGIQRVERVGPEALEEAPQEARVCDSGAGPSPLLGCRGARRTAPPNHRTGRDHAAAGHPRARQDDGAAPEGGSRLDDDWSRGWILLAIAPQLVKVVVYHLAPRADLASVTYLNGLERLDRRSALDLDVIAENDLGARTDV